MVSLRLAFLTLLITLGQVSGQQGRNINGRQFPQWLTGLIAVAVFLFLVLAVYVANRVWEKRTEGNIQSDTTMKAQGSGEVFSNGTYGHYSRTIGSVRSKEHDHVYDNPTTVTDNVLTTPM
ncbi:PDZK1-interacting protein 1 [Ascaphus truei]|uniref:PDZK1-interacting protein 1 n=1 Tax=Ascaphus truei TaxID=8439 RepID=UPI003F5AB30E